MHRALSTGPVASVRGSCSRSHRGLVRAFALLVALAACSSDGPVEPPVAAPPSSTPAPAPTPVPPEAPTPPPPVPTLSFTLVASRTSFYRSERATLLLTAHDPQGLPALTEIAPDWESSDPAVAWVGNVGTRGGHVIGLSAGTTTISATLGGQSISLAMTVLPEPTAEGSSLVVESFHVIEVGSADYSFYAPQLRLRSTGSANGTAVVRMEFVIPGRGPWPPCSTRIDLRSDSAIEIFPDSYGDFSFELGGGAGRLGAGAPAFVLLTVMDAQGATTEMRIPGPIVPGMRPTPSTAGTANWSCRF